MGKKILTCPNCEEETFAEGDCPNDLIESSGWIQSDKNWDDWFCSDKCKKEYEE